MYDQNILAGNIQKYRKKKNISQQALAEKLNVSAQAVSKWECGQAAPGIENIMAISDVLGVSVDVLLRDCQMDKTYMIGIDGGGTKTEFVLFDNLGNLIQRIKLEGSNPNTIGIEHSIETFGLGIDTLMVNTSSISSIFIGAAGLDGGKVSEQICNSLKKRYSKSIIACQNDIANVVACGEQLDDCVAAICGTGTIVYANKGDRLRRFGGYGYLLDMGGSGFDIGRAALLTALEQQDGFGSKSLITDFVVQQVGRSVWDNISTIYEGSQSYVASLAPCVFSAYENGDKKAREILEYNAGCLAERIKIAIEKCHIDNYVVASGGIITNQEGFKYMVKNNLPREVVLDVPPVRPIYGACIRAAMAAGVEAGQIKENLKANL